MSRLSHTEMRALAIPAFATQVGRDGTRPELQCFQAVGFLETGYASTWKEPGVGSWNFGAIQGTGPAGSFVYTDTHPQDDGSSKSYSWPFRKYPTAISGVNDLVRVVYLIQKRQPVLAAATAGDVLGFSTGLHSTGYYEGFGKTTADRIGHHRAAVLNACRLAALEIGEPMPDGSDPVPLPAASLHQGMISEAVREWQEELVRARFACNPDSVFGPKTRTLTILYQQRLQAQLHVSLGGLGVVGPLTRAAVERSRIADGSLPKCDP